MDILFDLENSNMINQKGFRSMDRGEKARLWKTQESEVVSHKRRHCSVGGARIDWLIDGCDG